MTELSKPKSTGGFHRRHGSPCTDVQGTRDRCSCEYLAEVAQHREDGVERLERLGGGRRRHLKIPKVSQVDNDGGQARVPHVKFVIVIKLEIVPLFIRQLPKLHCGSSPEYNSLS